MKPDGSLLKRKARLCGRGFSQTEGVDYNETFAPIAQHDSMRTLLSIVATEDMEMIQFDVKTAFLNGKLEEEVYMEKPEGYVIGKNKVCILSKAIYGLKQASRSWNIEITTTLKSIDFKVIPHDNSIFIRKRNGHKDILCLYVDDGLVCSTSKENLKEITDFLASKYTITVNEAEYYDGIEIKRNRQNREIQISQTGYINQMLNKIGLMEADTQNTPLKPGFELPITNKDNPCVKKEFRRIIESLLYN